MLKVRFTTILHCSLFLPTYELPFLQIPVFSGLGSALWGFESLSGLEAIQISSGPCPLCLRTAHIERRREETKSFGNFGRSLALPPPASAATRRTSKKVETT